MKKLEDSELIFDMCSTRHSMFANCPPIGQLISEKPEFLLIDNYHFRSVERTVTDVLFVGTTNGRVLKISANTNALIEAFQVFPYHIPVRNLLVSEEQVIVLSDHEVNAFPLERCNFVKTCGDCVALQDPYCAWDLNQDSCIAHNQFSGNEALIQDLEHGYHAGCPLPKPGKIISPIDKYFVCLIIFFKKC